MENDQSSRWWVGECATVEWELKLLITLSNENNQKPSVDSHQLYQSYTVHLYNYRTDMQGAIWAFLSLFIIPLVYYLTLMWSGLLLDPHLPHHSSPSAPVALHLLLYNRKTDQMYAETLLRSFRLAYIVSIYRHYDMHTSKAVNWCVSSRRLGLGKGIFRCISKHRTREIWFFRGKSHHIIICCRCSSLSRSSPGDYLLICLGRYDDGHKLKGHPPRIWRNFPK